MCWGIDFASAWPYSSCEYESHSRKGVQDTTLRDKVCQRLAAGLWFFRGTLISSTNKTDCHDITDILMKVVLNTISLKYHCINNKHSLISYELMHSYF